MANSDLNFARPPIVEAVLDLDCDQPPGQRLETLESAARDGLSDRYPEMRSQLIQEHQLEIRGGEPPVMSVRGALGAYQFVQGDGQQLIQVRALGYSFNRLAPYTGFDQVLGEVERTWRLYVQIASPVQVRAIRLRYINRVLLPLNDGRVDLDEYLNVGPKLPDEERLAFAGFLNQQVSIEKGTGHQAVSVLTTQPVEGNTLPLIFDNTVAATVSLEPTDWPSILRVIQSLRDLKNHIFGRTLTAKCLNLFH